LAAEYGPLRRPKTHAGTDPTVGVKTLCSAFCTACIIATKCVCTWMWDMLRLKARNALISLMRDGEKLEEAKNYEKWRNLLLGREKLRKKCQTVAKRRLRCSEKSRICTAPISISRRMHPKPRRRGQLDGGLPQARSELLAIEPGQRFVAPASGQRRSRWPARHCCP
jgi:hypothetical protein